MSVVLLLILEGVLKEALHNKGRPPMHGSLLLICLQCLGSIHCLRAAAQLEKGA